MSRSISAAAVVAMLAGTGGVCLAQPYAVTGIGNLAGGPSIAWGVSSWPGLAGAVVGETDNNNSVVMRGCTFTTGLAAINSGSGPGGNFVPKIAYRMNSNPATLVHVGSGSSAAIATRAFRTQAGLTFELGTTNPFLQNSEARGVNFNGVVVGTCWATNSYPGAGNNNSWAFQWVPTSGPADNNGTMSMIGLHAAYDVNDSGIAVGSFGSFPYRLVLATNAQTNLGTLGGPTGSGVATAINNAGVVVGSSPIAPVGLQHAFRWTPSGGMQDINPAPLGAGVSYAYDIQDGGGPNALIVGRFISSSTGPNGHAFIYNPANGVFKDLNTWLPSGSGWILESAHGINDSMCVVGRGRRNGQLEGFKMCVSAPVPGAPPCPPIGPLTPVASHATCVGGTVVFEADTTAVGGGPGSPVPVQAEWAFLLRPPAGSVAEPSFVPVVDGLNSNPYTGEPLFVAVVSGGGGTPGSPSIMMTDVSAPVGTTGGGSSGWEVRVMLRSPCDTIYLPAGTMFVNAADVGVQGGLPGRDGILDNNDFIVFIDKFFTSDTDADLGVQGGGAGRDGQFDNNDFISFIEMFFQSC